MFNWKQNLGKNRRILKFKKCQNLGKFYIYPGVKILHKLKFRSGKNFNGFKLEKLEGPKFLNV
jgi:hypothetical protein